jgi:RNA-directed DNA polymerase
VLLVSRRPRPDPVLGATPTQGQAPLDSYTLRLLSKQDARCTLCGDDLLTFEDPPQTPQGSERWYLWVTKKAIAADHLVHHDQPGRSRDQRTYLVHTHCSRMKHPVRAAAGTAM